MPPLSPTPLAMLSPGRDRVLFLFSIPIVATYRVLQPVGGACSRHKEVRALQAQLVRKAQLVSRGPRVLQGQPDQRGLPALSVQLVLKGHQELRELQGPKDRGGHPVPLG